MEDVNELESPVPPDVVAFFFPINLKNLDRSLSGETGRREGKGVGAWTVGVSTADDRGDCITWARLGRREDQPSDGAPGVGGGDTPWPRETCVSGPWLVSGVWYPRTTGLSERTVAVLGGSGLCRAPMGGGGRSAGASSWYCWTGKPAPVERVGPLEPDEYVLVSSWPCPLVAGNPYLSSTSLGGFIWNCSDRWRCELMASTSGFKGLSSSHIRPSRGTSRALVTGCPHWMHSKFDKRLNSCPFRLALASFYPPLTSSVGWNITARTKRHTFCFTPDDLSRDAPTK